MATVTLAYDHSRDPMNPLHLGSQIQTSLGLPSAPTVDINPTQIVVTHPNVTAGNTAAIQSVINAYVFDAAATSTLIQNQAALNMFGGALPPAAIGPQGPPGTPGTQGIQGIQGIQGPPGPGTWDTMVKTSADRVTSSLTATDVPDLLVALLANSAYEFEAVLRVASSSAAGCKYAVNFSAAGASAVAVYSGATTATAGAVTATNALATLEATAFVAAVIDGLVVIQGLVTTGVNAGNLTIQQAKVTSGNATVRANSVLKVRKV